MLAAVCFVRRVLQIALCMGLLAGTPVSAAEVTGPISPPIAESIVQVPFGGMIERSTAASVASAAARIRVLENVAGTLFFDLAVRLGATDPEQQRALTSAIFPVTLLSSIVTLQDDRTGSTSTQVSVAARIWAAPRDVEIAVREALRRPDTLELRFMTLHRMSALADEGLDLLRRSASNRESGGQVAEKPFIERIRYLSGQLEAATLYLEVLRQFDTTWTNAQEAVLVLEKAIPLDPENPLLHLGLGEALLLLDRPYEALDALHRAARLPDTPARTFYIRGVAHLRLKLPTYADDDLSRAIERRPEKPTWWQARGAARLVIEDYAGMCEDLYQACVLGECGDLEDVRKRGLCEKKE